MQPPKLPEIPFRDIAVDLYLYSRSARRAVDAGIVMLERSGQPAPGTEHAMAELERTARAAEQVYAFFRDAVAYEPEIRALIAILADVAGKEPQRDAGAA